MTKITPIPGPGISITHHDKEVSLEVLALDQAVLAEMVQMIHEFRESADFTFLTIDAGVIKFYKHEGPRDIPVFLSGFNKQLIGHLKDLELHIMQKWDELFPVYSGVR